MEALTLLLGHLNEPHSAALAGSAARTLAEQIDREKQHLSLTLECSCLAKLWPFVSEKDALVIAHKMVGIFNRDEKNHLFRGDLANLLGNLARHRSDAMAAVAAKALAEALCRQVDWIMPDYLSSPFQQAAERLPKEDAVATARCLVAKLADPDLIRVVKPFSRSLAALASRLEAKDAAATAQGVAVRLTRYVNAADYPELAAALAALASRLPRQEATAVVAPLARSLTKSLRNEPIGGTEIAAASLAALAGPMGEPETIAAFRAIAGPLARARSSLEYAGLCESLALLSHRLPRNETGDVFAIAAANLVERLAVERDVMVSGRLAAALTKVGPLVAEGELVRLLRAPLCGGQARSLVLDELGRRMTQRFADVWEFVQWARTNRPNLHLRPET
jgi:hypothetical protein